MTILRIPLSGNPFSVYAGKFAADEERDLRRISKIPEEIRKEDADDSKTIR